MPDLALAPDVIVLNDYAHVEGGGSQVAILSARALAERGRRVLFFAAVGPQDPGLAASGVQVVCLDQPDLLGDASRLRAAARGLWNHRAATVLASHLDRFDPARTVVHLHGWGKGLSSSVGRVARMRGFATVLTLHDYAVACPAGGFYDFRRESRCGLRPMSLACICRNCDARRYGHKLWRVGRTAIQVRIGGIPGGVDHLISVSDTSEALLRPHLRGDVHVHRVRNPVAADPAQPVRVAANRTYVALGRLAAEKGARLFAVAARQAGVAARFVGDGYLRDVLVRINPSAEVTGWLDAEGVAGELAQARALVFASQWPEAQGLAVAEALARGVPVVASDGCAAREAIMDGENGLLFRSGDIADLARALARLQSDHLATRLGRNAYERFWADPPTPAAHAASLEVVYRSILRDHNVRHAERQRPARQMEGAG